MTPSAGAGEPPAGGFKDLFRGASFLFRGVGWMARRPLWWLFGLIPAAIVLAVYVAAFVGLAFNLGDLAGFVTPFADDWSERMRGIARVVAGIALLGATVFVAVLLFTTLTLLVGDPFYEKISARVEESEGGCPEGPDVSLLTSLGRMIKDALLLGLIAVAFGVLFFACGFIPVVGQTVVPVIAACVSGYFLTAELTTNPLERRGLLRKDRFAVLKRHRWLVVGFGAVTFAVFLIPLGVVLAMPGAVAGGTLLARAHLIAEPQVDPDIPDKGARV